VDESPRVRELLLEDANGRVRAKLRISEEGRPVIEVLDTEGSPLRTVDLMDAAAAPRPRSKARLVSEDSLDEWRDKVRQEVLAQHGSPVNAYKLYIDFREDYRGATKKYVNEVLVVSGEIVEVQFKDFGDIYVGLKGLSNFQAEVICHFSDTERAILDRLRPGQRVRIRGKCTEYVNKRVKLWGCIVVDVG